MKNLGLLLVGLVASASSLTGRTLSPVYEAVVGEAPPPRKLTTAERATSSDLVRAGIFKEVPKFIISPRPVELRELPPDELDELVRYVGSPLDKLPATSGVVKNRSPAYPPDLAQARKDASVVCYFEVLPDGSVGRIFGGEMSARSFLIECAVTLKEWKFKESDSIRFMKIQFEASYARNGPK